MIASRSIAVLFSAWLCAGAFAAPAAPESCRYAPTAEKSAIFELHLASGAIRQLTPNTGEFWPHYSATGQTIYFVSTRVGHPDKPEIYRIDRAGGEMIQLTQNDEWECCPVVHDGLLAYAGMPVDQAEIYVDSDTAERVNLTNHPAHDDDPFFSPDGSELLFNSQRDGDWDVYVMNVDGTNVRQLTDAPGSDWYARFSPDGQQIVFQSERDGTSDIFIMNRNGTSQRNLTGNPAFDAYGFFSPDGRKIIFTSNRSGNGDLYVMDADGSSPPVQLTSHPSYDAVGSFSPDGEHVVFASWRKHTDSFPRTECGRKVTRRARNRKTR